ncbi:hypothetical protein [Haloplasma contractile]|uniref:Uncharacterized protein n=1 Tax=Haloplasma contractile SSD-17B TaxID=1033810 RepID=F7PWV9_9MOLU|nr:hypothetical protein [Haloplasma contractile]ERJ12514.1 hypothetical protein HLPCO_001500 [Haloplasma contractile SSD-17B]
MIVKRLKYDEFKNEFHRYSRENQFSDEALKEIYILLNKKINTIEILDVIGICSIFSELTTTEYMDIKNNSSSKISELNNGKYLIRH